MRAVTQVIEALQRERDALRQSVRTLQGATRCIVCSEAKRSAVLLPCKHLVLCSTCLEKEQKRKVSRCPECDSPVTDALDGVQF